jgi:hypothetical protein
MHDTDRTLAELSALNGSTQEAQFELEPEGDYENFENFGDFEFEPEANYEAQDETTFQTEANPIGEGAFDTEAFDHEGFDHEGFDHEAFDREADNEGFDNEGYDTEAYPQPQAYEAEAPSDEIEEMELAAELLEVQSDQEMENFIWGAVAKLLGSALKSGAGQQLVGLVKDAAKQIVPLAGRVIGGAVGGPGGATIGGNIADQASKLLGLELEGLAHEDQEFETARGFVRFMRESARQLSYAPGELSDADAARQAFMQAASQFAPGLLHRRPSYSPAIGRYAGGDHGRATSGRWVRVSRNQILLYGI